MLSSLLRSIALALALGLVASPARADEAEAEVGTPEPVATEAAVPAEAAASEPAPAEAAAATSGETPFSAEPIEAVHRPRGVGGALAIAADLLVMRPVGLVSLVPASAAFVLVSPVAAATCTLGDRADALRDRAADVFTRPLGAL
jgi:hypothetical protein